MGLPEAGSIAQINGKRDMAGSYLRGHRLPLRRPPRTDLSEPADLGKFPPRAATRSTVHFKQEGIAAMAKNTIIRALHQMMDYRLFESPDWLTGPASYFVIDNALYEMGLWQTDPSRPKAVTNTPLGSELDMDLMTVFLGMLYWPEVPMILREYKLITAEKEAAIYRKWPDDKCGWEKLLRPIVKQAYLDFFNPKKLLH